MKVNCRISAKVNAFSAEKKSYSHNPLLRGLILLGLLSMLTSAVFAQAPPPLNFGNNFFVTGDYIVAGAYNMTTSFQTIGTVNYAVGTIKVPDANSKGVANPGIQGPKQVPTGAQIVAALLYWQVVEKVGAAGSGQNGFFRPVVANGPAAPGYAIQGANISGSNTVSWSSGGCSGGSTGKMLRTYRADVGGALPLDASGNPTANGTFEVRLPSVGNSTPLTLGATLVVIYRVPGGVGVPLNAIVIYDGDYSQSNAQLTMSQKVQGFYDAAHGPISRLTHIVGSGQSNKFQTVYLGSGNNAPVALSSLYPKLPAFPGYYGSWDNPTWSFSAVNNPANNPVKEDAADVTTKVVPSMSNSGCVSWGAVIVSTTVKNSDADGILDSWKLSNPPGYCDASINNGICTKNSSDPGWVDLPGAATNQRDIFLQYDYMCSAVQGPASQPNSCSTANGGYSFDPRLAVDPADGKDAVEKVVKAFQNHTGDPKPFALHAVPGNAILEGQSAVSCTDSAQTGVQCPFPNEPGTVGFREGLTYIKNLNIDPNTGLLCTPGAQGCGSVPVFQHGKKDSYHYAMFSHGVGLPSWFLSDGSLASASQSGVNPAQSGNLLTFTTLTPHGLTHTASDTVCPAAAARVTVIYAITNPSLNGSYCATILSPTQFRITVPGTAMKFPYTKATDPNLAVADGQVTSMSGFSDVGGQDSVISLGYGNWGPPSNPSSDGNTWQTKAGTFMHELGHTLGMTHGGTFYKNLGASDYTPTFEPNCKPNSQSIMNYQFQVDLLIDGSGNQVLDFSKEALPTLTEGSPQPQIPGVLSNSAYGNTAWFQLTNFVQNLNPGLPPPKIMQAHCDGSPLLPADPNMTYVSGAASDFFWSTTNPPGVTGNDVNFDGSSTGILHGHNEWNGTVAAGVSPSPGLDLQQVSSIGTISTIGLGGEAGALKPAGGGGALHPAGGGGALKPAGGGGALKPAGGGGLKGDITHANANAYTRPPRSLAATEDVSPRKINLSWTQPTFGQITKYNVYRAVGAGPFQFLHSILPVPPATTFPPTTDSDSPSCNQNGYRYEVTAFVINDVTLQEQESLPSNVVPGPAQDKLTACYTSPINLTSPSSGVQGSLVAITWTLSDDFYSINGPVSRLAANTSLVANGPKPGACSTSTATTLLSNGTPIANAVGDASTFTVSGNTFTFTWDTDGFCAGSYTFQLTLDSTQTSSVTSPLQLSIDIGETDSTPHITTLSVRDATVDLSYNTPLSEDGGVGNVTWAVTSGSLPPNISLTSAGVLNGTAVVPASAPINFTSQNYNFTVTATDSATPIANTGTEAFNLRLITPISLSRTDFSVGTNPQGVITADFNGDGKADLAIANSGDDTVSILIGHADGTFTALTPLAAGGSQPWSLVTADFDGDGNLDLAVTNLNSANPSTVSVFLGNGDGTFAAAVPYSVGNGPSSIVTGDFNGDGVTDLAVGNQNGATVSILIGDGLGAFSQPNPAYIVGTSDLANVATGDFDGDGNLDLAITSPSGDVVAVALGNGDGTFGAAVTYSTGNPGDHPIPLSAVDLGNGKLDLVVGNLNVNTVAILMGNGDGTFQPEVTYPANNGAFTGPVAMTTGDFDGDGKVDLAISNQVHNTVSILLGNGDGSVQNPLEFPTAGLSAADKTAGLAAGDFNGDGRADFAAANYTLGSVSVLMHLPQPPTNLAAANVTATQVPLTWTASTTGPVVNYNVYRSDFLAGPYSLQQSTPLGTDISATDSTVMSGHTYYYYVTTVTAVSPESVKSNVVTVTTP